MVAKDGHVGPAGEPVEIAVLHGNALEVVEDRDLRFHLDAR
jgi:hypothetical protein